jgi:hypothetical protein
MSRAVFFISYKYHILLTGLGLGAPMPTASQAVYQSEKHSGLGGQSLLEQLMDGLLVQRCPIPLYKCVILLLLVSASFYLSYSPP